MPVTAYGRTVSDKEICVVAANQWQRGRVIQVCKIAAEVFFLPSKKVGSDLAEKIRTVLANNGFDVPPKRTRKAKPSPDKLAQLDEWIACETAKQHIRPHVVTVSLEGVAQS